MAGRHLAQCRARAQTPGVSPVTRMHLCVAGRPGPALQPKDDVPRGVEMPPAQTGDDDRMTGALGG